MLGRALGSESKNLVQIQFLWVTSGKSSSPGLQNLTVQCGGWAGGCLGNAGLCRLGLRACSQDGRGCLMAPETANPCSCELSRECSVGLG